MLRAIRWFVLLYACAAVAQTTATPPTFHHVLGLEGAKQGAKGTVAITGGALVFTPASGAALKLPAGKIQDISIGNDSKRTLSGIGQVTMLAPYGSGRILSLFRQKLDVLTVAYRDDNGGLHGAIFSMSPGQAVPLKKALLEAGAKSSTPLEEPKPAKAKGSASQKTEPAAKKEDKQ
ncbi:MAG TPA: hypothetical protein VMS96_10540 [Terriglobales bacterium]|nr:hypothetical protein [Terriglobales bacterium]